MKKFLAIFGGSPAAMDAWMKMPDDERKPKEKAGMEAWGKWMEDHKSAVLDGSPLGKTKRVNKDGIADVRNEMGAWTLVQAESQEEAAKMFVGHPHYTIFPGEWIDVMGCMEIPKMEQ